MTITLHKWTSTDKKALMALCSAVDRTFLSDRLPEPYTEADADWWLGMVAGNEGKEGVLEKNGFQLVLMKVGGIVKGGKVMDVRVYQICRSCKSSQRTTPTPLFAFTVPGPSG